MTDKIRPEDKKNSLSCAHILKIHVRVLWTLNLINYLYMNLPKALLESLQWSFGFCLPPAALINYVYYKSRVSASSQDEANDFYVNKILWYFYEQKYNLFNNFYNQQLHLTKWWEYLSLYLHLFLCSKQTVGQNFIAKVFLQIKFLNKSISNVFSNHTNYDRRLCIKYQFIYVSVKEKNTIANTPFSMLLG